MLGTVKSVSSNRISVTVDGGSPQTISFDPTAYKAFDHGYATTIHKSQGATVDRAYVLASRSMDEHLSYVAMSRHRKNMRLYINKEDRPRWSGERQSADQSQRPKRKVRRGLSF